MSLLTDLKVTRVFLQNWHCPHDKRWVVNRGGTRSSKTTSICQQAAVWLLTGFFREGQCIPKGNLAVVRKHMTTLQATVVRDFEQVLLDAGLMKFVERNKLLRQYRVGDRMVEFVGADDEQKMRGFKATIAWLNEGNELAWEREVMQIRLRTERVLVVDFNPSDPYIWVNENLEMDRAVRRGDVEVIVSTYLDNGYLTAEQRAEIEELRGSANWNVYGLGEYGEVHGLVFPSVTVVDEMPQDLKHRGFGMDFGYSNGITTLIEGGLLNEKDVYLDQWFYQTGMKPEQMAATMLNDGVGRLPVAADAAGEWAIDHLKQRGLNIFPAKKGPDSVMYGIELLNSQNLHITKRSVDMLRERLKYTFRTDNNGRILNIPIDAFNHTWDAARYWAITYLKPRRQSWLTTPKPVGYDD